MPSLIWRPKDGPLWTWGRVVHLATGFLIPAGFWLWCGQDGLGFASVATAGGACA